MPDDLNMTEVEWGMGNAIGAEVDRACFAGVVRNDAAALVIESLKQKKIEVDYDSNTFLVDGVPIRRAIENFVQKFPFVRPVAEAGMDYSDSDLALTGNVDAHARLFKQLGKQRYDAWCARNDNARPGRNVKREVINQNGDTDASNNPWTRAKWNITEQGKVVRAMGLEKAQRIAAKANSFVGATKPTM